MPMKLTKTGLPEVEGAFLKAVASGKTDKTYFDDDIIGFGYRCRSSGRRSWVVHYERNGVQRKLTLGNAALIEVDQARKTAKHQLAQVTLGGDPHQKKAEERARAKVTLGSIVELYLRAREGELRERSLSENKRYLEEYFKSLHALPIHRIARRDVAAVLSKLATESGKVAASRARSTLSALFNWAIGEGLADNNPVTGTNDPAEDRKGRDRVLTDDELRSIWNACQDDHYGRILKLLILSGQRKSEVGGMVWDELDANKGTWTLPALRAKNGRKHTIALPELAWKILADVPDRRPSNDIYLDRVPTATAIGL
jgi:hypothetical protein